jgi:hypothetical protein
METHLEKNPSVAQGSQPKTSAVAQGLQPKTSVVVQEKQTTVPIVIQKPNEYPINQFLEMNHEQKLKLSQVLNTQIGGGKETSLDEANFIINTYVSLVNPEHIKNQLLMLEMENIILKPISFEKSSRYKIFKDEILRLLERYHCNLLDDKVWFIKETNVKNKKIIKFTNSASESNMNVTMNYLRTIIRLLKQEFPNIDIKKDYDSIDNCSRNLVHLILQC